MVNRISIDYCEFRQPATIIERTFLNYQVMKEEISPDNVFAMAEIIAFAETRYLIGYMGTQMQKVYRFV